MVNIYKTRQNIWSISLDFWEMHKVRHMITWFSAFKHFQITAQWGSQAEFSSFSKLWKIRVMGYWSGWRLKGKSARVERESREVPTMATGVTSRLWSNIKMHMSLVRIHEAGQWTTAWKLWSGQIFQKHYSTRKLRGSNQV